MFYTITHRQESGDDYDHITAQGAAVKKHTIDFLARLPQDMLYQYYVTAWNDDDIIEQVNADEWLEQSTHNKS